MNPLSSSPNQSAQQDVRARPSQLRLVLSSGVIAVFIALFLRFCFPGGIELSGDQNAQVVAAENFVRDGDFLVPLHWTHARGVHVKVPGDYRQRLAWFPPGYSALLAVGIGAGLNAAQSATLLY